MEIQREKFELLTNTDYQNGIPNGYNLETKNNESPKRMKWKRGIEFLLSLIGYNVGLGNIWRFPYLCAKNGGAVFLIPYVIFMLVVAFPLTFMELTLGQFSGKSAYDVWDICPALRGVGVSMACVATLCCLYFNTILSWILYYLVHSFMSPLPWTTCGNTWNSDTCFVRHKIQDNSTMNRSYIIFNETHFNNETSTNFSYVNASVLDNSSSTLNTAPEEFWNNNLLVISSGLSDIGTLQWHLVLALLAAWVIIFLCIIKGVRSVGKVVYFTATAPYIILTIILIRAVTLPGALRGIEFYLIPDFSKLMDIQIWTESLLQLFFSMGMGWGAFITMASYNKFNNNVMRDTIVFCIIGEGTSFLAGFVVFSVLGYMSYETGLEVADIIRTGPGLAFITYPEALSQLPVPQLWAVLFFLMLLLMALDSMFVNVEVCVTTIVDLIPKSTDKTRMFITAVTCFVMFLITLIYATQAAIYIFQLVDWYFAAITLYLITILESIVIGWIYGADRYFADIEMMLGKRPPILLKYIWRFVNPVILVTILVFTLVKYKPPSYGDYHYPAYASVFGWILAIISSIPIPIWFVKEVFSRKGSIIQRIRDSFKPNERWGPSNDYNLTKNTPESPF
ncbi:sodium- and chloride-dependent GABA transporter 1 isoform X1 [Patella vulgata]|uniref:sodium- and chloride-dependent GABA transporter 1 isoform X1 n=1 Tax=Patella vulgata TaxID=6465 RepID=UPI00217FD068|nr:sodium- and chloride-dependent GABA transporter 1 isoform X1 [Patella vulgata]